MGGGVLVTPRSKRGEGLCMFALGKLHIADPSGRGMREPFSVFVLEHWCDATMVYK